MAQPVAALGRNGRRGAHAVWLPVVKAAEPQQTLLQKNKAEIPITNLPVKTAQHENTHTPASMAQPAPALGLLGLPGNGTFALRAVPKDLDTNTRKTDFKWILENKQTYHENKT
jgi:hypothetical protein